MFLGIYSFPLYRISQIIFARNENCKVLIHFTNQNSCKCAREGAITSLFFKSLFKIPVCFYFSVQNNWVTIICFNLAIAATTAPFFDNKESLTMILKLL